jgi:hypothetical protein
VWHAGKGGFPPIAPVTRRKVKEMNVVQSQ